MSLENTRTHFEEYCKIMKKSELKEIIKEVMVNEDSYFIYKYEKLNPAVVKRMNGLVNSSSKSSMISSAQKLAVSLRDENFETKEILHYAVGIIIEKMNEVLD